MQKRYFDILIIGAGVSGATAAHRIASKTSQKIGIIDAGPEILDRLQAAHLFASAESKIPSSPYPQSNSKFSPAPKVTDRNEHGFYNQINIKTPLKSTYEKLVGGSTWHWLGNTPRFIPSDFKLKSRYGIGDDWPIDYDDIEKYYCIAEAELGISADNDEWDDVLGAYRSQPFPMGPIWSSYSDEIVKGLIDGKEISGKNIHVRRTPQARNSATYQGRPPCAGNSSCVPICPIGAKYDASVHIEKCRQLGVDLISNCAAKKISILENGSLNVSCQIRDPFETIDIESRFLIIAANSVETPMLLQRSKIGENLPIGNYLMDHLQGYGGIVMPEKVYPYRGPLVTSGIDDFRDGPERSNYAAFKISIGNDGWGRMESLEDVVDRFIFKEKIYGKSLADSINHRATRLLRFSFSTEMLPEYKNKVTLGEKLEFDNYRPNISFSFPRYNQMAFDRANDVLKEMFAAISPDSETKLSYPDKQYSGAGHIMGTTRMGNDPSTSVVDRNCLIHHYDNIYIAGPSVFTTCGTANPTLTSTALSLMSADHLISRLKS